MSGSDDSIEAMSERLGMNKGRLTSLIRLSYLAPEIVGALLAGGHPIWHRDRFPFCRGRPERERRFLSNASRPRCRRPNRNSNVRQGRAGQPVHHGALGIDCRRVSGGRLSFSVCRSRGRGARSRAFDLASLPQGRGTGRPRVIGNGVFSAFGGLTFEMGAGKDSDPQPDRYERAAGDKLH
jgi:hypothetical protein